MMKPTLPLIPRMTQTLKALPAYMLPRYSSQPSEVYRPNTPSSSVHPSSQSSPSHFQYSPPSYIPTQPPSSQPTFPPRRYSTSSTPQSASTLPAPTVQWNDYLSMV